MKKFSVFFVWFCVQTYAAHAHIECWGNIFEKTCQGINFQGEPVYLNITGMPQNKYISGYIGKNGVSLKSYQIQNTIRLQGYFGQSEINVQAYEVENTEFATGHIGAQNFNIRTYKTGNSYHIVGFIGMKKIDEQTTFLEKAVDQIFQMPFIPIAPSYFQTSFN